MSEELVAFFKALADSNRLKIGGLLAQKPYSVEELAALVELKPSTVSHHLAKLAEKVSRYRGTPRTGSTTAPSASTPCTSATGS